MHNNEFLQNTLRLVFPPVCSYHADKLIEDEKVCRSLEKSNLYMLATKPKAVFGEWLTSLSHDPNDPSGDISSYLLPSDNVIKIPVRSVDYEGNSVCVEFSVDLDAKWRSLYGTPLPNGVEIFIDFDEKNSLLVFSYTDPDDHNEKELWWCTPDSIIYDLSRQSQQQTSWMTASNNWRSLSHYRLVYAGISKKQTTLDRLFKGSHEKRQSYLNNYRPSNPDFMSSEELILFAFTAEAKALPLNTGPRLITSTTDSGAFEVDVESFYSEIPSNYMKYIIPDAEKAIVQHMLPELNSIMYKDYPLKNRDGLSNTPYKQWQHMLGEDLLFYTTKKGKYHILNGSFTTSSKEATTIFTYNPSYLVDVQNGYQ